jgi:hypothetical protein
LKSTLHLEFRNNVDLARVVANILKINVKIKGCNSVVELISKFPELGGTCRIINNFRVLLRAVKFFEVTEVSRPLALVTIVDTTFLPNNEFTAQQNQTN